MERGRPEGGRQNDGSVEARRDAAEKGGWTQDEREERWLVD